MRKKPSHTQLRLIEFEDRPAQKPGKPAAQQPIAPTTEEWRALYAAAGRFRDSVVWDRLSDKDAFGVKDPANGEIGLCLVISGLGGHRAFVFDAGARSLIDARLFGVGAEPKTLEEFFETQSGLGVVYVGQEDLEDEDRQVLHTLGLSFPGSGNWPQFRSYLPGYLPWFLTGPEARLLTTALEQATEVLLRSKDDRTLLRPSDGRYLIRVQDPDGKSWHDERLPLEPGQNEQKVQSGFAPPAPALLAALRKLGSGKGGTWEIGISYFPTPFQDEEGERPYFARQVVIVHQETHFILGTELSSPADYVIQFQKQFLSAAETLGSLPEKILIKGFRAAGVFGPLARELGIPLTEAKRLPGVEHFERELKKHLPPGLR